MEKHLSARPQDFRGGNGTVWRHKKSSPFAALGIDLPNVDDVPSRQFAAPVEKKTVDPPEPESRIESCVVI